jgi:hypothetical protein
MLCFLQSARQTETITYKVDKFLISKVFHVDLVFQGSPTQTQLLKVMLPSEISSDSDCSFLIPF